MLEQMSKSTTCEQHFAGIERFSEYVYANVYSKADSANVPYKVRIKFAQFWLMEVPNFNEACKDWGAYSICSPPIQPTYKAKEEFYAELSENSIVGTRREFMQFLQKYNPYRSHVSWHGFNAIGVYF